MTTLAIHRVQSVAHVCTHQSDFVTHDLIVTAADGSEVTITLYADVRLEIPDATHKYIVGETTAAAQLVEAAP